MKNSQIDKIKEKAKVAYRVKQSFIGRNFYLFYGVCVVWAVAAAWSATTAAGNIYIRTSGMLGPGAWAALAAIIAGVTLVGLQYISGKGAVDDLQIGILKTGKDGEHRYQFADRAFFFLKAAAFVFVTGVSITLSINGVATANDWFRNERRPFQGQAVDVSFFDREIDRLDRNIAEEQTRKWKGVLVTDASRRIAKYEAQKAKLIESRQAAIAQVDARNADARARYDAKTESNENLLQGFGGVAEIVIIFCVIFIGLYDDGLYREANAKGTSSAPSFAPPMGFQRGAPAFGERDDSATMQAENSAMPKPVVVTGFRSPVAANSAGNIAFSVAPSQPKAQQPSAIIRPEKAQRQRNESAEIAQLKKEKQSAQSAIRNARTAQRRAQRELQEGAIDEAEFSATMARLQVNISRNEKRIAQLEKRLK